MRLVATAMLATLIVAPAFAQVIAPTAQQPGQADKSRVEAATYQVDPHHTMVSWEVNHMGFSMLEGLLGAQKGTLVLDPAKPGEAKLDITFAIDEMKVTTPSFGEHLMTPDFFDAKTYPTAHFVSTSVTPHDDDQATIEGNLTIRDQTKPVTIEAVFVGAGTNPINKKLNVGFEGTSTIKRSDFGLAANGSDVSDDVHLTIHAAFVKS